MPTNNGFLRDELMDLFTPIFCVAHSPSFSCHSSWTRHERCCRFQRNARGCHGYVPSRGTPKCENRSVVTTARSIGGSPKLLAAFAGHGPLRGWSVRPW